MNCHYVNYSSNYQVIVLLGRGWEKTLGANQDADFMANPSDYLEVRETCSPFNIAADRIPCHELSID